MNRPDPVPDMPPPDPADPPTLTLDLHHRVRTAVTPSPRVCEVAAMFGLGVDAARTLDIVPPTELTLGPGRLIFVTGASGGGKTTLLRLVAERAADHPALRLIDFDALAAGDDDRPLVEALGGTLEQATRWLAMAGLNDAFVMLRRPGELSDGQRYRYRLAHALASVERAAPPRPAADAEPGLCHLVLADEFAATLDRLTAAVIARNVRKWVTRSIRQPPGVCFIAATTHDDLLEPLDPDTLIVQRPGEAIELLERPAPTRAATPAPPG